MVGTVRCIDERDLTPDFYLKLLTGAIDPFVDNQVQKAGYSTERPDHGARFRLSSRRAWHPTASTRNSTTRTWKSMSSTWSSLASAQNPTPKTSKSSYDTYPSSGKVAAIKQSQGFVISDEDYSYSSMNSPAPTSDSIAQAQALSAMDKAFFWPLQSSSKKEAPPWRSSRSQKKAGKGQPISQPVNPEKPAETHSMVFEVDWDPVQFCVEQNYSDKPSDVIESAITITGSNQQIQALSCVHYLHQTWPATGKHVMALIKNLLANQSGSQRSCRTLATVAFLS